MFEQLGVLLMFPPACLELFPDECGLGPVFEFLKRSACRREGHPAPRLPPSWPGSRCEASMYDRGHDHHRSHVPHSRTFPGHSIAWRLRTAPSLKRFTAIPFLWHISSVNALARRGMSSAGPAAGDIDRYDVQGGDTGPGGRGSPR